MLSVNESLGSEGRRDILCVEGSKKFAAVEEWGGRAGENVPQFTPEEASEFDGEKRVVGGDKVAGDSAHARWGCRRNRKEISEKSPYRNREFRGDVKEDYRKAMGGGGLEECPIDCHLRVRRSYGEYLPWGKKKRGHVGGGVRSTKFCRLMEDLANERRRLIRW